MTQELSNPEFRGTMLVGTGSVAAPLYWLVTDTPTRK